MGLVEKEKGVNRTIQGKSATSPKKTLGEAERKRQGKK